MSWLPEPHEPNLATVRLRSPLGSSTELMAQGQLADGALRRYTINNTSSCAGARSSQEQSMHHWELFVGRPALLIVAVIVQGVRR